MVGVGITVYYPDYDILRKSVGVLQKQECEILLFSNMGNTDELGKLAEDHNIDLICSDRNIGVAGAFNRIMEHFASKEVIEWVMLLDQDSVCPCDYIEAAKRYFDWKDAGIICPVIDYLGTEEKQEEPKADVEQVDWCISSGSFNKIRCWRECGGFDEQMFIDWVDLDYCLSIAARGYRVVRMNFQHLKHQLGALCEKKFLGKRISVMNHDPERQYYYVRNAVKCCRKHKSFPTSRLVKILAADAIKICFFERNKRQKAIKMAAGFKDGIKT